MSYGLADRNYLGESGTGDGSLSRRNIQKYNLKCYKKWGGKTRTCPLSVLWEGEGETPSLYSTCDSLRLCRKLTQDQGKNPISQHLMSAFTKRCCKFALASWIRGISKHPTSVKNNLHFRTFLPKSLHNPNKCLTFAAREPAKPLNDAQPTTNREQCQTCLNIAEVRRRKRFLEAQMCGSFFYMYL